MVIGKFNQYFARHGRLTFTFILVVLGLSMTFYFGPSMGGGSGVFSTSDTIGTLGTGSAERSITLKDLNRQISRSYLLSYVLGQPSENWPQRPPSFDDSQSLGRFGPNAIEEMRIQLHAKELGLDHVSTAELAAYVTGLEGLKNDGVFDKALYDKFKEEQLKPMGLQAVDFDGMVREQIILNRMMSRTAEAITFAPSEVRASVENQMLKAEAQVARFQAFEMAPEVTLTEEEIKAEYNAYRATRYLIPEQRKALVAVLPLNIVPPVTPATDAEVEAYYKANEKRLYTRNQVRARMILLRLPMMVSPEDKAAIRARMDALRAQAMSGADFAELAKANSEDPATKAAGGDLGFFGENGRENANVVFSMKDGDISPVQASPDGLRLFQRLEGRTDVVDIDVVREQIRNQLNDLALTKLAESRAKAAYDAERAKPDGKYTGEVVHARHILLSTRDIPADDEAKMEGTRQKLEAIRAEAIKTGDFQSQARQNSDDPGSQMNGGDLGWFGRGQMIKEFEDMAFSLKDGEISPVFKTMYGFHIIQKVAHGDFTPYSAVKDELVDSYTREAREGARKVAEAATMAQADKLGELYTVTKGMPSTESQTLFREAVAALGAGVSLKETGPFSSTDRLLKGISGDSSKIISGVFGTSLNRPLTRTIKGSAAYYVALLSEVIPAREPTFEEARDKVEAYLRNDRAREAARTKAREKATAIAASMGEGKTFEQAAMLAGVTFAPTGPFSTYTGPRLDDENTVALVRDAAQKTKAGTPPSAFDSSTGAVLIYISKHTLPSASEMEASMAGRSMYYGYQLSQLVMSGYSTYLEGRYPAMLDPQWSQIISPAPKMTLN